MNDRITDLKKIRSYLIETDPIRHDYFICRLLSFSHRENGDRFIESLFLSCQDHVESSCSLDLMLFSRIRFSWLIQKIFLKIICHYITEPLGKCRLPNSHVVLYSILFVYSYTSYTNFVAYGNEESTVMKRRWNIQVRWIKFYVWVLQLLNQ